MNRKEAARLRAKKIKIKEKRNTVFVGIFLFIVIATILARLAISITNDIGLYKGHVHVGFWANPQEAFKSEFKSWNATHKNGTWTGFLDASPAIRSMIKEHPSYLWTLTQFTWLTTYLLLVVLIFRLFKFENRLPRAFKWLVSENTLSGITFFEITVGIGYWGFIFTSLYSNSSISFYSLSDVITTTMVHLVIPVLVLIYSTIFTLTDKKASVLSERFALKALVWPVIYMAYYLVASIIWNDPYPVTHLHKTLVGGTLTGSSTHSPNWAAWAKELWRPAVALVLIYSLLGILAVAHNILLVRFNKSYSPKKDYDFNVRYDYRIKKLKKLLIRRAAKRKEAKELIQKMHLQ